MVYSLLYRRPAHTSISHDSSVGDIEKLRSLPESMSSGSSYSSRGIPAALSFDRIIAGGACPPCSLHDFLNYLKYVEHSAENLQFFLWYRDYCSRWQSLPEQNRALAPPWSPAGFTSVDVARVQHPTILASCDAPPTTNNNQQHGSPQSFASPLSDTHSEVDVADDDASSSGNDKASPIIRSHEVIAEQAFEDAGLKRKPFTTQPFREEVNRIVSVYIANGAPRELNLSGKDRLATTRALQNTTHPSAFQLAVNTSEFSLRKQAHPNFIRWTICNGNRPRVLFAKGLGIAGIVAGFVGDLLITLSSADRVYRIIPFLGWFVGIATLVAATKGMCVVLHGMHHRHLRPWELFAECDLSPVMDDTGLSIGSLTSVSTNAFEDESWVIKYGRRNIVRKVFDREVWVREPALRQIQDTIFLQAVLGAFSLSCLIVGIFCAVPAGRFY